MLLYIQKGKSNIQRWIQGYSALCITSLEWGLCCHRCPVLAFLCGNISGGVGCCCALVASACCVEAGRGVLKPDQPVRSRGCNCQGSKRAWIKTDSMLQAERVQIAVEISCFFFMHVGCPPARLTHKRPDHGQVSVHGEPKFIEGQQPYVQKLRGCDPAPKCTKGLVTVNCGWPIGPMVGVRARYEWKMELCKSLILYI